MVGTGYRSIIRISRPALAKSPSSLDPYLRPSEQHLRPYYALGYSAQQGKFAILLQGWGFEAGDGAVRPEPFKPVKYAALRSLGRPRDRFTLS